MKEAKLNITDDIFLEKKPDNSLGELQEKATLIKKRNNKVIDISKLGKSSSITLFKRLLPTREKKQELKKTPAIDSLGIENQQLVDALEKANIQIQQMMAMSELMNIRNCFVDKVKQGPFVYNPIKSSFLKKYEFTSTNFYTSFTFYKIDTNEIIQHYVLNNPAVNSVIRTVAQSKILSNFRHFTQNLLGKISIQSFVNRSTRQSYKLLPEF